MKNKLLSEIFMLSLCCGLFFITGCTTGIQSKFYILSTISKKSMVSENKLNSLENKIAIGIGPVKVAKYLERPEIVTLDNQNQLQFAEFDRWADSLQNQIPVILMENISILLKTDQISLYPWRTNVPMNYQIIVEIIKLNTVSNGNVELVARWNIFSKNAKRIISMRKTTIQESIKLQGYNGAVIAQSKLLAKLSYQIASEIIKAHGL